MGAGARACCTRVRACACSHTRTHAHTHVRAHTHAGIGADELGDYDGDGSFPGCDPEAARLARPAQHGSHVSTRRGYSESSVLSNSSGATTATTLMHVSGRPPSPNHSNRPGSACQGDTPASPRGRRGSDAGLQDRHHREEARISIYLCVCVYTYIYRYINIIYISIYTYIPIYIYICIYIYIYYI